MSNPLLKEIGKTAPDKLEDLILVMAKNIEYSLIRGGASPGKDYTIKDLYSWAMPFALVVFKNPKSEITYRAEW